MNWVLEILRKTHPHVLKLNRHSKVLISPPRAFRNAKFLKYRYFRSELKAESDAETDNLNCNSKRWEICKILVHGNEFKDF